MPPKRSKNQIRRERAKLRKVQVPGSEAAQSSEKPNEASETPSSADAKSGVSPSGKNSKDHSHTSTKAGSEAAKSQENENKADSATSVSDVATVKNPVDSLLDQDSTQLMQEYEAVFQHFEARAEPQTPATSRSDSELESESESGSESESDSDSEKPLTKRQLRLRNRIPVAELKAFTTHPELVEWYDADAPDPYMAVQLKTMPNVVDVPSHWQQKKDYLSAKRGMDRPPFRLPKYIEDTGIAQMRNHDPESLKKLQRDRVQPKMGRLDIDYQKLHDAFFKFQTQPRVLPFGELYYEGREKNDQNRDKIQHMRPGKISRELRAAVGLPENEKSVPPWIVLMNELGKPPAYSDCVIPGVDIEYSNLGYKLARDEDFEGIDMSELMWGKMEEGEESEAESEEESLESEREDNKEYPAEEEKEQFNGGGEAASDEEPEKVDITEYSRVKTFGDSTTETSSGTLYTVLKERSLDASKDGLVEGRQGYEYGDAAGGETKKESKTKSASSEPPDFKF